MAKMTAVTTVLLDTGLPQISPTQSKDSGNALNQAMFHTENTYFTGGRCACAVQKRPPGRRPPPR